jgi:TfoX/Sxy family transcriptional regulator of competence genes
MKIPRPSERAKEFFKTVLPIDSRITMRPMFGNLAGFVNGKLFSGLYGDDLFIRLDEKNREELLKISGTSLFEPMKGRKMKEYVVVPKKWFGKPETVKPWIKKSLAFALKLPKKK